MEAIISWTNVERFLLTLYLDILGGPTTLAAASYLALDGKGPKDAALRAVAQAALSEDNNRVLAALLKRSSRAEKPRNRLAHWMWGCSPQIPEGFLLADPRDSLGMQPDPEKILVYTARDFEDIIFENDRLCDLGLLFRFVLMEHPKNEDGKLYRELCLELAIPETQESPGEPSQ